MWELNNPEGERVSSFKNLADLGVNHFKSLFCAPGGATLAEITQLARVFPRFVEENNNASLLEDVTVEELKEVLHSFQHDKSPGPDGWPIEFYVGFFDLIGRDLLGVVNESKRTGVIHGPINATFIALIPKTDKVESFEDFRPISLCNCLYKIIAKVISRRLKRILSNSISPEQFGFLHGR